ncbi:MAG: NapC/NirT family cytochrome c, partial [Burkholderiales bacterium]|nr:NapC/NirT family cytochrome c [Burkholderiales bacterium]
CPDCHVPRDWVHKIQRKIRASNELWHWALGTVDTPEKFNAKRLALAQHEWDRMKGSDSRECRNCHSLDSMDYTEQGRRAVAAHSKSATEGKTCIDCHKGIAHTLPPIEQNIGAPKEATSGDAAQPEAEKAAAK